MQTKWTSEQKQILTNLWHLYLPTKGGASDFDKMAANEIGISAYRIRAKRMTMGFSSIRNGQADYHPQIIKEIPNDSTQLTIDLSPFTEESYSINIEGVQDCDKELVQQVLDSIVSQAKDIFLKKTDRVTITQSQNQRG